MAEYTVHWDIELDAETPEEAARQALEIQRDPNSWATVFSVARGSGTFVEIDLQEIDSPEKEEY